MQSPMSGDVGDRHLDLGCGDQPRNPYGRPELYGVDIRAIETGGRFAFRAANLAFNRSVRRRRVRVGVGVHFIEHMPRVLNGAMPNTTVFPFVRLMDEVWRVLAPGGMFYAVTPCYPGREAFVDPTHVNIITDQTHDYFCGAAPRARMYGFGGAFNARRAEWVIPELARTVAPLSWQQEWRRKQRAKKGKLVYFLWELEAVKPAPR
jgi:SAM-dependent methyltransferase